MLLSNMATLSPSRALSSESNTDVADTFSHVASLSSTPPTTVGDGMSITSETSKPDITIESTSIEFACTEQGNVSGSGAPNPIETEPEHVADAIEAIVDAPATPTVVPSPAATAASSARPRRQRESLPVYNLSKLAGTDIHGKRRANGDVVADKKRRTESDADLDVKTENGESSASTTDKNKSSSKAQIAKKRALELEPPKRATRSTGVQVETFTQKISSLGKRSKKALEQNLSRMSREMRRLQDTNEFSGVETKPVLFTTWAKGKYVESEAEPPRKKAKVSGPPKETPAVDEAAAVMPEIPAPKRRVKKWLGHGLYSGQDAPLDVSRHLTPNEKKALVNLPELVPALKVNRMLPMPIFTGLRQLIQGRDFKLPFDTCNPLPSGQPKPSSWKLMTRSTLAWNPSTIDVSTNIWYRSIHWRSRCSLEEIPAFQGLSIQVCMHT